MHKSHYILMGLALTGCHADKGVTAFNSTPEISILSHSNDSQITAETDITFLAAASDLNNNMSELTVEWLADLNTLCPPSAPEVSGESLCVAQVPIGTQNITAIVKDPSGASDSDQITIIFANQPPQAQITSHNNGASVSTGDTIELVGQASDTEDDYGELSGSWFADGISICPQSLIDDDGQSVCTHTIEPNTSIITFTVIDTEGAEDSDSIELSLVPTEAPEITILSPLNGSSHNVGTPILFSGLITDADTSYEDLSVQWQSSIDGVFAQGLSLDSSGNIEIEGNLSEGAHIIELIASDPQQNQSSSSISITVSPENTAPTCSILDPLSNDTFEQGTSIIFSASATDAQTPSPSLVATWNSSIDGILGNSQPSSSGSILFPFSTLSMGTHLISLEVSDPEGMTCVEQILLLIGSAPTLAWSSPAPSAIQPEGNAFLWEAQISDDQDPPEDLIVSWSSNLDGTFSSQGADSSGTVSFSSTLSVGTHLVTLTVTDTDGMVSTLQRTVTSNGLPSSPAVTITPTSPSSSDSLLATASGSIDPEGSSITYQYEWLQNGIATTNTSNVVPSTETSRGELWTVIVTPNDGLHDGLPTQSSVTIENSAPNPSSISITPTTAYNDSSLTCTALFQDDDGDTITNTYSWTEGNTVLGTSDTISLNGTLSPQTTIACTATGSDGSASSTQSTTISLVNRDPFVNIPTISPSTGLESGIVVTCATTASDPDNDATTITYSWDHNGSSIGSGDTIVLPSILSGDQISCTATATDPFGATHSATQTVSAGNGVPTITNILLSPSSPTAQTGSISCLVSTSDPDGDPVTVSYEWSIDGVVQSNTTSILSGPFAHPSSITCTATPSDGNDVGTPQSATTSIDNTLPSVSGLNISPNPAYTTSIISATYSILDLDTTQSTSANLEWHKIDGQNGTDSIVSTAGSILPSSFFVKGDSIYVKVTPYDGFDLGATVQSSLITISNTPPTSPSASISPSAPFAGVDDLICSVSNISADVDGDPITYTFVWRDGNGSVVQTSNQTLLSNIFSGSLTQAGTWTCTITANDGSDDSLPTTVSVNVSGECASHSDCPGLLYCAQWFTDGLFHCSDLCISDTDCQSHEECVNMDGSANVRYCTPVPSTAATAGSSCSSDSDCGSGVCMGGYCESHCGGEDDCLINESCHAVGNPNAGDLYSTCGPHSVYQDINQSCTINGVSGGEYCETGHCDIHEYNFYNNTPGFEPYCRPLCNKESDCDLSGPYPEVCDIVIVANSPSNGVAATITDSIPYSSVTACFEPWMVGSIPTGSVCSQNSDCASNKCFNIMFGSSQRYCSAMCETNADCGGGTTCRVATLNTPNEWMVYHSSFTVTQLQGMTTLTKLCAF